MQGAPNVQAAAAVALAHCYTRPAVAAPLFTAPKLLGRAMSHWIAVVDILSDSSARVVHAGMVAVDRMITAYQATVSAREAEQAEGLQSVLAHFAWAGAIRLRSAAAHVLDRMARMPAALQVDAIAAMTSAVDLIMSRDPPVRLDAFGALLPNPAADTPPDTPPAAETDPFAESDLITPEPPSPPKAAAADATETALHPPVSDGWICHALGAFCLALVDAPDAAAATEAARALLHLNWLQVTLSFPRLQVAPVPDQWARAAVSALFRIGDPADAIASREAVTQIVCRYLCVLSPEDVPAVARKALHWIVQRSSASARVSCLQLVWRAAVDVDLSLWRRSQAEALAPEGLAAAPRAPRPHGNVLIELLEDPLIKALRAGDTAVRSFRRLIRLVFSRIW